MALEAQNNIPLLLRRILLIALIIVSVVCMSVYSREDENGVLHRVQSAVEGLVAPLQMLGMPLVDANYAAQVDRTNAAASTETLEALRIQNAELSALVSNTEEYRKEAERLRALLAMKNTYGVDGVTGRVIGRTTDSWNQTITLDVGSAEGVAPGMTVIGSTGVAGQVISVEDDNCVVRLLTDPQSGVAALIQSSRAEGIVRGSLAGVLYLENVSADVTLNPGDVVLTSGLGGSFTKGLFIGTITRIEGTLGDATRRVVVAPNEDASPLEEYTVVFSASLIDSTQPEDAANDSGDAANGSDEGSLTSPNPNAGRAADDDDDDEDAYNEEDEEE